MTDREPFRFGPRGKDVPRDVQREIETHLELRAREFEAQGMSAEEARRAALALIQNTLCLQQKRLPEALRADDDEFVITSWGEECINLGRSVEQRLVEILRNTNVIRIDSPSSHRNPLGEQ